MEIQINVQEAATIAPENVEQVVHHHNNKNINVRNSVVKLPTIKQPTHLAIEPPSVEIDANQIAVAAGILDGIDEDLKRKKQEALSIVKAIPVKESGGDTKVTSSITALFEALLAIFALSSESRKLAAQQRQVANQANINSIQAQAAELRSGAIAMIVVATVGAAVAAISTFAAAKNVLGAHKNLKVTKGVTRDISLAEKQLRDLDQMNEAGQALVRPEAIRQLQPDLQKMKTRYPPNSRGHLEAAKQARINQLAAKLAADKAQQLQSQIGDHRLVLTENELAGRVSDATSYAVNASSQAVTTAVSGFGQAAQGWTNANAKEHEADSAQWQHILEVIKEMLQSDDQILSQMTQSFQQISDSLLSAWKQGTTLA